jgi:hypothetical protein
VHGYELHIRHADGLKMGVDGPGESLGRWPCGVECAYADV